MNEKFIEFLFKRIGSKISDLHNLNDYEDASTHLDDLDEYVTTLKEIITEVIMP